MAIRLACASTSCCVADAMCLPMDMIKMRMQLQNEMVPSSAPRLGVMAMSRRILRVEGAGAFWAGLGAAMARQATYGGLSFWSYPYVRDALARSAGHRDPPTWAQLAAGAISGGVASAIANPTDVVKVRLQADGRRALLGEPRKYSGGFVSTLGVVFGREGGLAALYAGLGPNVSRAAVVNGVGIAAYDSSKSFASRIVGDRPLAERFLGACVGGVATAIAGCPFDVVKTRLMARGAQEQLYTSALHCLVATVSSEGSLALWKGIIPVYCRQAPFNLFNYIIMEFLLDTFARKSRR
ncbi:hypothetical protein CTAYLR_008113 [Chrysophaeum taylorii]|uniref:Mitochondrial carrier protein n=1 Tax=Chrysophaeum taylorii TaxID=2483200 RepID=A0AAD7XPY3_9STRA|nr:hypothetical protein CTAYLR_008113 [Chrysophaeum taylorii]